MTLVAANVEQLADGWERHTLPSGAQVAYHDPTHRYFKDTKDGKGIGRLVGVTTAVKAMDLDPTGLLHWAAGLTCQGIAALASEGLGCDDADEMRSALAWLRDGDAIKDALRESSLTWTDIRDQAATRGTNVHEHVLHALARGDALPAYEEMTEEERGYAQGIVGWWLEAEPQVIATEYLVADLELGVAGRPDLLCNLKDGRVALVDAKTSKRAYATHVAQLAAYHRLGLLSGYEGADVGVVLVVGPDGSHSAVEVPLDEGDFLAALDVYRRSNTIAGVLRKAARA